LLFNLIEFIRFVEEGIIPAVAEYKKKRRIMLSVWDYSEDTPVDTAEVQWPSLEVEKELSKSAEKKAKVVETQK